MQSSAALKTHFAEREESEQLVTQSEGGLRNLVESIGDCIARVDKNIRYLFVNAALPGAIGLDHSDCIGMTNEDLCMPADFCSSWRTHLSRVFETKKSGVFEIAFWTADGSRRIFHARATPEFDAQGEIRSTVVVMRDLTERVAMEKEFIKAKKLETARSLAGGVALDLNNLLGTIMRSIASAKLSIAAGTNPSLDLAQAEKAVLRAADFAGRFKTFAGRRVSPARSVSVKELIMDTASPILTSLGVESAFFFPDNLWKIEVDEAQLRQVVAQLIINASEAMPRGGKMEIGAENVQLEAMSETSELLMKKGSYVRISFKDRGIGIPGENLDKIFDPYFSTKAAPLATERGMGLSIAHSIIENHGGYIFVESQKGFGTTFHIYIPSTAGEVLENDRPRGKRFGPRGKVLIMDPDWEHSKTLAEMLVHLGYGKFEFAGNPSEAEERFRRAKMTGSPFAIVILDASSRGGAGGRETIKTLIHMDPSVRAIVSTNHPNDPMMLEFAEYGFDGALTKPFHLHELRKTLEKVAEGM